MSSSLQRAVQRVGSTTTTTPLAATTPTHRTNTRGSFEACFSHGLDLSEFETATSSQQQQVHVPCASAELLRVQQEKLQQRLEQERQDAAMAHVIQQRTCHAQEVLKQPLGGSKAAVAKAMFLSSTTTTTNMEQPNAKQKSLVLKNFLVQLHQDDPLKDLCSKASRRKKNKMVSSHGAPSKLQKKSDNKAGKNAGNSVKKGAIKKTKASSKHLKC